jgi:Ca2+-binding RTX toxin-like protein
MAARRRRRSLNAGGLPAALALVAVATAVVALTATNAVPATKAGRQQQTVTADSLKPAACSGIALTTLRVVAGVYVGTNADELILGSAGIDDLDGRAGTDCVVGGAGADVLRGGGGTDVCIGGPGIDTFSSCETAIQ